MEEWSSDCHCVDHGRPETAEQGARPNAVIVPTVWVWAAVVCCSLSGHACEMETPPDAMLEVFAAGARQMTTDRLLDLRNLFRKAREHPATVEAVDRELRRRAAELSRPATCRSR